MRWGLAVMLAGCAGPGGEGPVDGVLPIRAVTWNTGTSESMGHDAEPDDGYTSAHAARSDAWYGDGLAWLPAVDAATAWLDAVQPDVIGFQEIFWSEDCAAIPAEEHADFVCETWPRASTEARSTGAARAAASAAG